MVESGKFRLGEFGINSVGEIVQIIGVHQDANGFRYDTTKVGWQRSFRMPGGDVFMTRSEYQERSEFVLHNYDRLLAISKLRDAASLWGGLMAGNCKDSLKKEFCLEETRPVRCGDCPLAGKDGSPDNCCDGFYEEWIGVVTAKYIRSELSGMFIAEGVDYNTPDAVSAAQAVRGFINKKLGELL